MSRSDYTEYILRFSYGKDSFKCLDVIHTRGLPLDRITTTDVWATDTVPGWLPPMQDFKDRMDDWIWTRYRLEVEHLCAMNKDGTKKTYEQMFYHVPNRRSQSGQVERERERERLRPGQIQGFPVLGVPWCQSGLKRNSKPQNTGNNHRLPTQHGIQLVPEAQDCVDAPKGFLPRSPAGAKSSRSITSKHPFPLSAPRGAKKEISWNIWASPQTSRTGSAS